MSTARARTETRVVRPFLDISEILKKSELRVEKDGVFSSSETVPIEDIDPKNLEIALKIPLPPTDIEEKNGIKREDISIVIIVTDQRLKKSACLFQMKLDEVCEDPYEFTDAQMNMFYWKGNVSIDLAAVLGIERPVEPNKPFLAGHWIAKKRFTLNARKDNPAFPIIPLPGEDFANKFNMPKDTVYFIEYISDTLNVPFSELDNTLRIYIHEDVYNSLLRNENSPSTRLQERIIMTEIFTCILAKYLTSIDAEDLTEDSVIKTLINRVEESTGYGLDSLKGYAKSGGYSELKAIVQSYLKLKRAFERGGI